MYLKVDSELIKKIEKITMTDYECLDSLIPSNSIEIMLQDLLLEIERLEEKYKDLQQDISENYDLREKSVYEQYGIRKEDFY